MRGSETEREPRVARICQSFQNKEGWMTDNNVSTGGDRRVKRVNW